MNVEKMKIIYNFAAMKQLFFILLTLALLSCNEQAEQFTIEVLNSYTPVKDQGKSSTCWAYAMLAAIETEHIMMGDSVHLSVAWVEHMLRKEPHAPQSLRAMAPTAIHLIQRYGLVPYDAMPTADDLPPKWAFMLGAQYTPLEFAHSVCRPDEYIALGSSDAHPYNELFTPDVPDNWEHNQLMNLTADSLLAVTETAVRNHHGVCWEGDISEYGFDRKKGIAREHLVNGTTTDDHCMAIVGIARDAQGELFFIMKNSWGDDNPYHGLVYMSFAYFKQKTIAVVLPRT